MSKQVLKTMVETILRNVPAARNSDITLLIEVWRRYYPQRLQSLYGRQSVMIEDLYDLPREDNVKRIRAQFNAQGKYYPTDWRVAQARGIEEDQWRIEMGYPRKDQVKVPLKAESYMDQSREFESRQQKLI